MARSTRWEPLVIGFPLGIAGALVFIAAAMVNPIAPAALLAAICAFTLAVTRPLVSLYLSILLIPFDAFNLPVGGSGLSPYELMFIVTAAGWLIRKLALRQPILTSSRLLAPYALLTLTSVIDLLIVPDPGAVIRIPIMWTVFLVVYQMVVVDGSARVVERIALAISVVGAVSGLFAVAKVGAAAQLANFGNITTRATTSAFAQPDRLGEILALAIPFQFVLATRGKSTVMTLVAVLCVIPTAAGLIYTLSRAAFVATAIALIFLLIAWPPLRRIALGAAAVLAVLIVFAANPLSSVVNTSVLTSRINSIQNGQNNPRVVIFEKTLPVVRDHPIFGVGPDQYQNAAAQYNIRDPATGRTPIHAHNIFLNIAAERGLLGLAALIWFVIAWWRTLTRARRRLTGDAKALAVACTAAFLVIVATGLADYSWQANTLLALTLVLAGSTVALEREAKKRAVEHPVSHGSPIAEHSLERAAAPA